MDGTGKSQVEGARKTCADRKGFVPAAVRRVARFRDDETGAMLVFGLMCLVAMLFFSGISVDVIRYESMRTRLQNTLDNATLAAANLDQTQDPTTVVQDYMNKAGLGSYLGAVTVTSGLNARTVTASAKANVAPAFMSLAGIKTMTAPAYSTASESIGNVEISLVLDVSGSMNSYNKIGNLRDAAKSFVTTMFNAVDPGKLSISIVPYAAQVTAGPGLYSYFKSTNDHNYSYCFDFDQSDFTSTDMPLTHTYQQAGNFDPWYTTTNIDRYGLRVCPKESSRYVLPFSGSESDLKTMIGNLQAGGNTSIDVGMKWGAALLDPSLQPVVTDMVNKGSLPAEFAGRPYDYGNKDAMKVIVVMTDGENTSRPVLQAPYNSGPSLVYNNSADSSAFSLYDASRNEYYWTVDQGWHTQPYGSGATYQSCSYSYYYGYTCTTKTASGTAAQMSWPDVWENMSVNWFISNIVNRAYGSWTGQQWKSNIVHWQTAQGSASNSQDTQLLNVCSAAKNNYVTIYSIGFMASTAGKTVLKECATKPSYFYDVQSLDIATAFASIANSINKLRLTQ